MEENKGRSGLDQHRDVGHRLCQRREWAGRCDESSVTSVGGERVCRPAVWIARGNRRKKTKGEEVLFAPSLAA